MQYFPHAEGYVQHIEGEFFYVYNYTDHLGNIRLSYTFDYASGLIKIMEENHYYPFGLKHDSYNTNRLGYSSYIDDNEVAYHVLEEKPKFVGDGSYNYKYNGKELQDELGLNVTAMDFRQYDPALGRFNSMDVLSEIFFETSPYAFTLNNPVFFSDPTGLCPECPDNAKMNDTYVSDGGATYIFGDGGWIRQDGELDEVVVTGDAPTSTTEQVADVVTDFIPFVGSGKDIYNGFKNDDPLLIAMGVGFFVVDIFTLGSGSIVKGAVKTAGKQIAKEVAEQGAKKAIKIQKHHIVPKKVFKETGQLADVMKRDIGQNLKKLPSGFHGNHPSYSDYVQRKITEMIDNGTLNEQNIKALQHHLSKMINKAYDNYKVTGENLNTYFKALDGN